MRMPTDAFRFDKFALILIHLIVKKVFFIFVTHSANVIQKAWASTALNRKLLIL